MVLRTTKLLERHRAEDANAILASQQLRQAHALVSCSRDLMTRWESDAIGRAALSRALEQLRLATRADRAFIFRNLNDAHAGFASGMVAEAVAVDVAPHLPNPPVPILAEPDSVSPRPGRLLPWGEVPPQNQRALASGKALGGPLERLFADSPQFLAELIAEPKPVLSVQFFPIFVGGQWRGYVGFDDCQTLRAWHETEVATLRAAAELIGSTLQRWRVEASLSAAQRYDHALWLFSQSLLINPTSPTHERQVLSAALQHLLDGAQASRAYIIRNIQDTELGECVAIHAEARVAWVNAHIDVSANQRFPWSRLPARMRTTLEAKQPFGGPIHESLADAPELQEVYRNQRHPLLSFQLFPIHANNTWWGFVGFNQTDAPRRWHDDEITVLRTAAEMLGSTLQRWQAEVAVVAAAVLSERQRLARELHDAVAQSLYSQTLFARAAAVALEDGNVDKARQGLDFLENSASQALREMRLLLHELRPYDLTHKRLSDAVEERLALVEQRAGVAAICAIDPTLDFTPSVEDALYRIIVEALNNALRHAAATDVEVCLRHTNNGLTLTVRDNGVGFEPSSVTAGLGLANMRDRAAQLGATLHIESTPGQGALIEVRLPSVNGQAGAHASS